ncbi:MAG: hypothetical protein AB9869_10445 [Verrucomicrobiia bacterium]
MSSALDRPAFWNVSNDVKFRSQKLLVSERNKLTDPIRKRALAANPAPHKLGTCERKRGATVWGGSGLPEFAGTVAHPGSLK